MASAVDDRAEESKHEKERGSTDKQDRQGRWRRSLAQRLAKEPHGEDEGGDEAQQHEELGLDGQLQAKGGLWGGSVSGGVFV